MGSKKMQFNLIISSALIFLWLGSHKAKASSAECPEPWINLEELGCFYFAVESKPLNWYDAQIHCNDLNENAFLAGILNEETQFLLTYVADNMPDNGWWLGATDFYQEGEWRWMKSEKRMEYSNWANNQPDNHSDTFNRTEDCLQIWSR